MLPEICQLAPRDLVEFYSDMIKYNHYDPMCTEKPSKFNEIALREEIIRRLNQREDWLESDRQDKLNGINYRAI